MANVSSLSKMSGVSQSLISSMLPRVVSGISLATTVSMRSHGVTSSKKMSLSSHSTINSFGTLLVMTLWESNGDPLRPSAGCGTSPLVFLYHGGGPICSVNSQCVRHRSQVGVWIERRASASHGEDGIGFDKIGVSVCARSPQNVGRNVLGSHHDKMLPPPCIFFWRTRCR